MAKTVTVRISGGAKLKKYLKEMRSKVDNPGTLNVGFLKGSTYPNGTPVALVAAVQNFGSATRGIPPRPFFSNMVKSKSPEWPQAIETMLKKTDYNARDALRLTGEGIKGQLKQSIIDTNEPPLAPATIARKGFDKPLIDTSHMINSVDYEVK